MRKTGHLTAATISVLLFLVVAGIQLVSLGRANPIEAELEYTTLPITAYTFGSYVKKLVYYQFNTNMSSSVIFSVDTIPVTFPTTLVVTACSTSVVLVSMGLAVYFKKLKKRAWG